MKYLDNSGANTNGKIKIYCNTAVIFFFRERVYTPGTVGSSDIWMRFTSKIADDLIDVFWAEWRGSFGTQQAQTMSMGVYDACTLRMDYHPQLYALLQTKEVLVIKDAAPDAISYGVPVLTHPDVYTLWGAADDIRSMHQIMEFKVRRYEGK